MSLKQASDGKNPEKICPNYLRTDNPESFVLFHTNVLGREKSFNVNSCIYYFSFFLDFLFLFPEVNRKAISLFPYKMEPNISFCFSLADRDPK